MIKKEYIPEKKERITKREVAEKPIKREESIERKERPEVPPIQRGVGVEKVLIENFISLQHVMTNLAVKFDNLSSQISKLLELFEISAKTLAEKGYSTGGADKQVTEKLDSLLEQNKVIAKGISLLHEKETPEQEQYSVSPMQRPQMSQMQQPMQRPSQNFSRNPKFRPNI